MQWIAKYKDGTIIRQYDRGDVTKSDQLDRSKLQWFRVTEGIGDFNLKLNCESGKLTFSNLDLQKLSKLSGGEKISFVFDKDTTSFKLDKDSFDLVEDLILKNPENYFYMQIDSFGIINVCGKTFCAGVRFNEDKTELPFYGKLPNFKVMVDEIQDIQMGGNTPMKSTTGVVGYRIILDDVYTKGDVNFEVSYEVVCDLIKWQAYVIGKVKPSKTTDAKLYVEVCGKREVNPFSELVAGNVYSIRQFMGVI